MHIVAYFATIIIPFDINPYDFKTLLIIATYKQQE